jgi:hypothetical protein
MAGRIDPRAQFPDACHDAGHLADDLRDTVEPAVDFLLPQRCSGSPDCSDTLILPRLLPAAHPNVLLTAPWSADKEGEGSGSFPALVGSEGSNHVRGRQSVPEASGLWALVS